MAKKTRDRKNPRLPGRGKKGPIDDDVIDDIAGDLADDKGMPNRNFLEEHFPGISVSIILREEVYMRLIFQLMVRGYTLSKIAEKMRLERKKVGEYKKKIQMAFESEMAQFSILGHVGGSVARYREFQAQAAKMIYSDRVKDTPKIMAINAAVNAEDRVNMLLKDVGAFKNIKYTPNLTNNLGGSSDDDFGEFRAYASAILSADRRVLEAFKEDDEDAAYELSEKDIKLIS